MRRLRPLLVVGGIALIVGLSACQPSAKETKALDSPQGKQAQLIVKQCIASSGGDVKKIETCLAPGGAAAKAKFESCATHAVIYVANKVKFENALDLCVVNDR